MRLTHFAWLASLVCCGSACLAQIPPEPATRPASTSPGGHFAEAADGPAKIDSPWRYKKDVERFDAADEKTPPPAHPVVFIGSSTFTRWKTSEWFPQLPVVNRAFGGSTLPDVIYFADKVAFRYHPKVVVIYCGENDAAGGRAAETVVDDFVRLIELLKAGCPEAKLIYLGLKPSPVRQEHWQKYKVINTRIEALAQSMGVTFLNPWSALTTPAGEPRPELFVGDRLHNNDAGYTLLKAMIEPAILQALKGPPLEMGEKH